MCKITSEFSKFYSFLYGDKIFFYIQMIILLYLK